MTTFKKYPFSQLVGLEHICFFSLRNVFITFLDQKKKVEKFANLPTLRTCMVQPPCLQRAPGPRKFPINVGGSTSNVQLAQCSGRPMMQPIGTRYFGPVSALMLFWHSVLKNTTQNYGIFANRQTANETYKIMFVDNLF